MSHPRGSIADVAAIVEAGEAKEPDRRSSPAAPAHTPAGQAAVRPAQGRPRWGRGSRYPLAPWRPGVVEIGRGYVRLRRKGRVGDRGVVILGWRSDRDEEVRNDRKGSVGRGDSGMSSRSRLEMQRLILSLPWELLGRRALLITLTYPGDWHRWVRDGRVLEGHRRAFFDRWRDRWGVRPVGFWAKEFQARGAPHLHLYVGLPETVSEDDYAGLVELTKLGAWLESEHGRYEGRRRTPPLNQKYGGEFGLWLRDAWSSVVGTSGRSTRGARGHHVRGAQARTWFVSERAEQTTDRGRVALYLSREAGKWVQKQPPENFRGVGRWYGVSGKAQGFVRQVRSWEVGPQVCWEYERALLRLLRWRGVTLPERRYGDGLTALSVPEDWSLRILVRAERLASRCRSTWGPVYDAWTGELLASGGGEEVPGA